MISMNNVQILGKVTMAPRIRKLKTGTEVAELGLGLLENYKSAKGEWESRMHFVDVVLWDDQARFVGEKVQKGDGLLVQGSLQFDQWEGKDGGKRSKLRVKGQRVQRVPLPEPAPAA